ncbi:hypothetical protein [Dinoroseobacter sp. S76]|uniref:hypothetical protein n=1 Tax=Dinoroseobacter sp. S76 TaxID=3415124 RepID=UPI003C7B7C9B
MNYLRYFRLYSLITAFFLSSTSVSLAEYEPNVQVYSTLPETIGEQLLSLVSRSWKRSRYDSDHIGDLLSGDAPYQDTLDEITSTIAVGVGISFGVTSASGLARKFGAAAYCPKDGVFGIAKTDNASSAGVEATNACTNSTSNTTPVGCCQFLTSVEQGFCFVIAQSDDKYHAAVAKGEAFEIDKIRELAIDKCEHETCKSRVRVCP